jgi:hypothetical protein
MPLWNKLLRRSPNEEMHKDAFPVDIELIPGKLTAKVYLHEIPTQGPTSDGAVSCWSYVTSGLWAHKQKEVIFTLRRGRQEADDGFPRDPLHLFTDIYHWAQQGRLVDAGDVSQFSGKGLFGRHLLYIRPQPLQDVTVPDRAITALLVTEDEVIAVQEFGISRVVARLGQVSQYYPCPSWSDRLRPGLSFERTRQESLLARVARIHAPGVRACKEGKQIIVRFAPRAGEQLQQNLTQVPAHTPFALLTDLDPKANGCFVWEPGQAGATAITPPNSDGSRLSGCFVVFIPEATENGGRLLEDGFALMLTSSSWTALRQALLRGETIAIPGTNDTYSALLEWIDEVYHNPVDGVAYVAAGGWESYHPQSPRTDHPQPAARLQETQLLSTEQEFATEVSVSELNAFMTAIGDQVQQICAQGRASFELLIQCTLHPTAAPTIRIASRGDADQVLAQDLYGALTGVHALNTRHGSVAFQMHYVISPGTQSTDHSV